MLDGDRWGADAVPARRIGSGFDPAAWSVGIFIFVAVYDSGVGALCHGLRAGHDGGGVLGSSGGYRSFRARDGATSFGVHREARNHFF